MELKKGVGIAIKVKKRVASHLANSYIVITDQPALATCGCLNTIVAG